MKGLDVLFLGPQYPTFHNSKPSVSDDPRKSTLDHTDLVPSYSRNETYTTETASEDDRDTRDRHELGPSSSDRHDYLGGLNLRGLAPQTQNLYRKVYESGSKNERRRLKAVLKRLRKRRSRDVFLKVYDITDGRASQYLRPLLGTQVDGIWHTGLVCFGKEHFYCDGIQSMSPELVEVRFAMTLRDIKYLGKTHLKKRKFVAWLRSEDGNFARERYDLINWNCNHFTLSLVPVLFPNPHATFKHSIHKAPKATSFPAIPDYVANQPAMFMSTARGRILVWMTKHVLERVDNFLNQHFAKGLDQIINKLFKR